MAQTHQGKAVSAIPLPKPKDDGSALFKGNHAQGKQEKPRSQGKGTHTGKGFLSQSHDNNDKLLELRGARGLV